MSPQRLLLAVGVPLGLLIVLFTPAWTGWDEHTHFLRGTDMADGSLFPSRGELQDPPGEHGGVPPTPVAATYVEDGGIVIANWLGGNAPWTASSTGDLLASRPDGRTVNVDLRATEAAPPTAYLPAAVGMVVPVQMEAPAVVAMWSGRLANLAAYLALAWLAVRSAAAFRWTLAAGTLLPMHLALGGTISPDAVTFGALLLVLAVWSRLRASVEIPVRMLLPVCLLSALAKPPYFLVLALLPATGFQLGTTSGRLVGRIGLGALGLGLLVTLLNSSTDYQAVSSTMIDDRLHLDTGLQQERLLGDLPGFLWATVETWFTELDDYVQGWFRSFGFFPSDLPGILAWVLLAGLLVAVLRLDAPDLRGLVGVDRWLLGLGAAGLLVVLYASSFVYFTDHAAYDTIGLQMARYSAPLLPLMALSCSPRWAVLRLEALSTRVARVLVGAVPAVAVGAVLVTWLWTGTSDRF